MAFRPPRSHHRANVPNNDPPTNANFDDSDDELRDKRRSVMRQGGTASSPDLKTLISKKAQAVVNSSRSTQNPKSGRGSNAADVLSSANRYLDTLNQSSPTKSGPTSANDTIKSSKTTPNRARSRTFGTNDSRHNSPRYYPKSPESTNSAVKISSSESMSLAQEIALSSPSLNSSSNNNHGSNEFSTMTGTIRERMKKTSGLIKKLRGDGQPKRDVGRTQRYDNEREVQHPHLDPTSQATPSLSRKPSHSSAINVDGYHLNHTLSNTSNSSSIPSLKSTSSFVSGDEVPVPSIPSRYAKSPASANEPSSSYVAHSEQNSNQKTKPFFSEARSTSSGGLGPPPRVRSSSRVPSAPADASINEYNPQHHVILPQRSSSQGHETKLDGSDSFSAGELRIAIHKWESEMDHVLQGSARDLDKKTEFIPKAAWGPSPQLPDLEITRYKERSGSFLEEEQLVTSYEKQGVTHSTDSDGGTTSMPSTPLANGLRGERSGTGKLRAALSSSSSDPMRPPSSSQSIENTTLSKEPTGLGIDTINTLSRLLRRNTNSSTTSDSGKKRNQRDTALRRTRPHSPRANQPTVDYDLHSRPESPSASLQTTRSSRQNSTDSFKPVYPSHISQRRGATSGTSLVSAKSFETADESTGISSGDPRKTFLNEGSVDVFNSPETDLDPTSSTSLLDNRYSGRRSRDQSSGRRLPPTILDVDQELIPEQSIRLVTKPSVLDGHRAAEIPTPTGTAVISDLNGSLDSGGRLTPSSHISRGAGLERIVEGPHSHENSSSSNNFDRKATKPSMQILSVANHLPNSSLANTTQPLKPTTASIKMSHETSSIADDQAASSSASFQLNTEEKGIELAYKCLNEDPSFLKKENIAEWLGGLGAVNKVARNAYFSNFDFTGLRVDVAFRKLCEKLFLRAETQQVDRILSAFSQQYFECNPNSIFGTADIIHSVVFSILLLNTDLHIAEIQDRMTRGQFVRNTMAAIGESKGLEVASMDDSRSSFSVNVDMAAQESTGSVASRQRPHRSGSVLSHGSRGLGYTEQASSFELSSSPRPSITTLPPGLTVSMGSSRKNRDLEVESTLKDIYAAVKHERILLPTEEATTSNSAKTLSPPLNNRRKGGSDKVAALKRGSIRGIQGLLGNINTFNSDSSLSVSPSATSRPLMDTFGRSSKALAAVKESNPSSLVTPGFASTLTQTIIKESQEEDTPSINSAVEEPDDDELALAGPPWAKEGSLTRKHYWDCPGKRARDKNWTELFVVVQRGVFSMFKFGDTTSSRTKLHQQQLSKESTAGNAVGGGNWLANATRLGEFNLAHTLANALPPPGYNRARPHVFALTLPGGAVYFFQAGHEELVHEWVQTCNYWAARQSKEPLGGGVSNMEYGWNRVLPLEDLEELDGDGDSDSISRTHSNATSFSTLPDASIYNGSALLSSKSVGDTRSIRSGRSSSNRSLRSRAAGVIYQNWQDAASLMSSAGSNSNTLSSSATSMMGSSTPSNHQANERIHINEWKPPAMPTVSSTLKEDEQLERCLRHMDHIEAELVAHNELRQPMSELYSCKGQNYTKAQTNWERKSNHLLQKLVKYQCYVESLKHSSRLRAEKRGIKQVDSMIRQADEQMATVPSRMM